MKEKCYIYIDYNSLIYGNKKDYFNKYDFLLNDDIIDNLGNFLNKIEIDNLNKLSLSDYEIYINKSKDNYGFFPKALIEDLNDGSFYSTNDFKSFKKIHNIMRYNCCKCNKKAVWSYDPMINNSDGSITPKNSYFCNKHVPKKCSTNNLIYYYFKNKKDFLERVNDEISNSSKKENKLLSLRQFDKNFKNKTLNIKNIKGYKKIIKFINKTEENILKRYELVPHKPGVEYSYEENGFIVYKDENYSFMPED